MKNLFTRAQRRIRMYDDSFYAARHQRTMHAASVVLESLLEKLPHIRSAVDVGCGVGTWLCVLNSLGVEVIQGYDGHWVNNDALVIPVEAFQSINFEETLIMPHRFDLALSLEVAEHLPATLANAFVETLTCLSDFVLFSAAIPGQGGAGHCNEQWQDYWVGLFAGHDYVAYDFIRPHIWNDAKIPVWYCQNMLFFCKSDRRSEVSSSLFADATAARVHPEMFKDKSDVPLRTVLRKTLRNFLRASFRR